MLKDYTNVLIEDYLREDEDQVSSIPVDKNAASQFYAGLKANPAYIDVEAFHKAYDELMKAAGLDSIFGNDGLIAGKWLYKNIKECTNSYAASVAKKLWAAQYVDFLKTKKYYEDQKARVAKVEQERKAKAAKEAQEDADRDAEVMRLRAEAVKLLDQDLVQQYLDFSGNTSIDDCIIIEIVNAADSSRSSGIRHDYKCSIKGHPYFYRLTKNYWPYTTENLVKYYEELLKGYIRDYSENEISRRVAAKLATLPLEKTDWTYLYFSDGKDVYRIYRKGEGNYHRSDNEFKLEKYDGKYYETVNLKDYPDLDPLKLIVLNDLVSDQTGRCYYHRIWHIYYNPSISKTIGQHCGVAYQEVPASYFDDSIRFLSDADIPTEVKALGLTKGERHSDECDSSD